MSRWTKQGGAVKLLLAWILAGMVANAAAQSPKGTAPKQLELPPQMQDALTAVALAQYGDANADALALITAARMLKRSGARSVDLKPQGGEGAAARSDATSMDATAVLGRARTLAGQRTDLVALIDETGGATRAAVDGPSLAMQLVPKGKEQRFVVDFRGGELATVSVKPEENADVLLVIQDETGRTTCRKGDDTTALGIRLCLWIPPKTQTYLIRVLNRGGATTYLLGYL
jgi:hypothetical protein